MKVNMGQMINMAVIESLVFDYYKQFFAGHTKGQLFEIYNVREEQFIRLPGRDSTNIMARDTLVKTLSEADANHFPVVDIIVIVYDELAISFKNPVFIGTSDGYYERHK